MQIDQLLRCSAINANRNSGMTSQTENLSFGDIYHRSERADRLAASVDIV